MQAVRLLAIFSVIPVTLLLTISFFVLYAVKRTATRGLRNFGYLVAVLLWLSALLVASVGYYALLTGQHPAIMVIQQILRG